MRLGVRPLVTLALCCAVLIWSSRPQYQERTPPRAEPQDVAAHRVATRIRAIEREVRRAAREMEAAGAATAAAADLFSSLKPLVRVQQQAVDAPRPPPSDRAVEAAPRHLPPTAKACAPGCEKMGNCNTELGRCDCQPFMGGDDCSKPLFDACQSMIGLKVVAPAPCVYDTLSQMAPVSCECLRQCESIGLMGVRECYVIDSKDEALSKWVRTQRTLRGLEANLEYWKAALAGTEEQSVQECGGRGVYAPAMPNAGAPRSSSRRCRCYAGFTGPRCEQSSQSRRLELCINACSNRGKCMRNWCHCDPGFYGVDCSLGSGSPGAPPGHSLPAPIGAQTDSLAPKLYIYELPPQYNSWMHAGSGGWWQDLDLWGEDVIIHRRALRSIYRVTDPAKADFFLVPIWVSSAMWQMNWGFRDLLGTGVRTVGECTEYIRKTWPYFDRHNGKDHIWVFGHDQGGWRIRAKAPAISESIFISPFGAGSAQRGGHKSGHDIVVPPVLYERVPRGLLNHAGRKKKAKQNLAFFQGKLNLHIPYEYSFGIRQGLYKTHRNTPGIVVKEGHEANREAYFENMIDERTVVAEARMSMAAEVARVVVMRMKPCSQDGIEQAFEDILPWPLFSLRLNNSIGQIARLDQTIAAIPEARIKAMRSKLFCVWPRFLWLRHDGSNTPLPGQERLLKFDAFESVMWTLRKRLRNDVDMPTDWDEGCREVKHYFESSPASMGSMEWAPWANYEFDLPSGTA